MIVTTMNDIPGYEVDEVFGEVMGLTVRSRNIGSQIGAQLKSIIGGELKGMTTALIDSRKQVMERMVEEAESKGANAIIAMRFDTSEMGGQWT
ncbi:MAG TPA: YbjQ family protein, partial [Bradyrhizobium sp.]|nr:YbjQ family protein [Bradyrhizobium sp.]